MRVLIADSAQVVRSALKLLVQDCRPDAVIVEAGSLSDLVELLEYDYVDVAMLDWALLRRGGYAAVETLRKSSHNAYIIILSGRPIPGNEPNVMDADAFVDKSLPPDTLHTILGCALSCRDDRTGGRDATPVRTSDKPKRDGTTRRQSPESHKLLT